MAGSFRNHDPAKNIQECIHNCCMAKRCDVAMMVRNRCYGVHCYNSTMCETVPAEGKAAEQDLQIAHVIPKGSVNIGKKYTSNSSLSHLCRRNGVLTRLSMTHYTAKVSEIICEPSTYSLFSLNLIMLAPKEYKLRSNDIILLYCCEDIRSHRSGYDTVPLGLMQTSAILRLCECELMFFTRCFPTRGNMARL